VFGIDFHLLEIRMKKENRSIGHVYKITELVGSSPNSTDDAVKNAITRAAKTLRNLRWFEVTETRGHIEDGRIAHWQVTVKVGFTLDDGA
jgi:flavin-binding protein dodecin